MANQRIASLERKRLGKTIARLPPLKKGALPGNSIRTPILTFPR